MPFARALRPLRSGLLPAVAAALLAGCGGGDEHHHGASTDLGSAKAGPFEVQVVLYGHPTPGGEVGLDVRVKGPAQVQGVTARLSDADRTGTPDEPLPRLGDSGTFHGHLLVPEGLPAGAALWVGVTDGEGKREEARFALP